MDPEIPRCEPPDRADVAVIGAGITGLAVALRLARAGASVVVLEAGRVGAGASARSGGLVLEGTAAGRLPATRGCIPALLELLEAEQIDCDLRLGGCWELEHVQGAGDGPGWSADGSRLVVSAHVEGGTLDPGRLLTGLARAALALGVSLCERQEVHGLEPGPEASLFLDRRELVARHVVLAAGAFGPGLLPLPRPVRAGLTLAIATGPFDLDAAGVGIGQGFYTVDTPYLWGRSLGEDRAIFGAGVAAAQAASLRSRSLGEPELRQLLRRLEERVRDLHPALAGCSVERRWAGPVSFREGAWPLLLRHPDVPQLIVSGAYAGHGLALGAWLAEPIARAILHDAPLPEWGA